MRSIPVLVFANKQDLDVRPEIPASQLRAAARRLICCASLIFLVCMCTLCIFQHAVGSETVSTALDVGRHTNRATRVQGVSALTWYEPLSQHMLVSHDSTITNQRCHT